MLFATSFLRVRPPINIGHKMDALILISAKDCNPNGNPEDNRPRQDQETGEGLMSGVCLKRHIRDTAAVIVEGRPGCQLYVTRKDVLERKNVAIYEDLNIPTKKPGKKKDESEEGDAEEEAKAPSAEDEANQKKARAKACADFIDNRWFGAVMNNKVANCGQVRGALAVSMARTIDSVLSVEEAITCGCLHSEQEAKTNFIRQTFGDRPRIAFGLYMGNIFFTPHFAKDVGLTSEDLEIFWEATGRLFEYTRSASRDRIHVEQVIVFEHDNPLGCAPSHRLFRCVDVARKDPAKPPRDVSDYTITAKEEVERRIQDLGYKGVTVHYLL